MIKQLQGGLVLRSLSENVASDRERLPDFYAAINTAGDPEHVQEGVRLWTRDLMNEHPNVTADDMFVIVDPAKDDMIVSATLLIPMTWRYEDVIISVGRPELVGTHPDYRRRGLVRELFKVIHERSAGLGHEVQAITGIPYFYRQFGYTMAVELGAHSVFHFPGLAEPAPDAKPAYILRPATAEDVLAISAWSAYYARERLMSDVYSPEEQHYEVTGRHRGFYPHTDYQIIVDASGKDVGFITLLTSLPEPYELRCIAYVVGEDASYLATFNDVMQGVRRWAIEHYQRCPEMLFFSAGLHETLDLLVGRSHGGGIRPREYAWYLRVADRLAFLRKLAPVLERRLAYSGAHRYTGELNVGFYDATGICFKFEDGSLTDISEADGKDNYDVSFPWNLFWNVVFGYRTGDEIFAQLPEAYSNSKAAVLLSILFPKKQSWLRGSS